MGAQRLEEEALAIRQRVLGPEHPDTLTSMLTVAHTLYAIGDLSRARKLQEEVLESFRRVLGMEHPHTLVTMNNLAATLYEQGDSAGAHKLHEKTLEVRRRVRKDSRNPPKGAGGRAP